MFMDGQEHTVKLIPSVQLLELSQLRWELFLLMRLQLQLPRLQFTGALLLQEHRQEIPLYFHTIYSGMLAPRTILSLPT